jgi:hypothetical protein
MTLRNRRRDMPLCAAFIADIRRAFPLANDIQYIHATEGLYTVRQGVTPRPTGRWVVAYPTFTPTEKPR